MADLNLVQPELRAALQDLPQFAFSADTLPLVRQARESMLAMPEVVQALTAVEERLIPGPEGAPDVRVLIHRPAKAAGLLPAILHIHGGGYVMGWPEMGAIEHQELVNELNCVIVSVDYRLAPETPHPGPIEDCYAALKWIHREGAALGLDPKRVGVSGESAGGGLAAALALLARDRGEVPLAFQHLIYPMLDDRTCMTTDPHPHTGHFVWTPESNCFGWRSLLGKAPGSPDVECYAAAARAKDLSGLPQTFISVGALDLFLDEDVDYALRLTRAAVPVELHVYPGAYHAYQAAPRARVTLAAKNDSRSALAGFLSARVPPSFSRYSA
jgi:acetyl esterase/lipase